MQAWQVIPFEGLGPLRFGSSRAEIRTLLGDGFKTFAKQPASLAVTDAYENLGLHLYYDSAERLEFIEAFEPIDPIYSGIHLLGSDRTLVLHELQKIGHMHRFDDGGYFYDELGFALYAPIEPIEAVSLFRPGYYPSP